MAPGMMLIVSFYGAISVTSLSLVLEKREGVHQRCLVAACTHAEIVISHALSQLLFLLIQSFVIIVITFFVLEIPYHGSLTLICIMVFLQGVCGMVIGLLISSICNDINLVFMLSVVVTSTNWIFSGAMWPIESMPGFV